MLDFDTYMEFRTCYIYLASQTEIRDPSAPSNSTSEKGRKQRMRKFKFIETLAHYVPVWQPRHVSRNMIPSTTNLDVLCGVQSRL